MEESRKNTAPSALLDSQSYDGPRCDPDTRVDVLADIDAWIQNTASPQKILCITGPVGCGKSALQRTTAEKYNAKGALASAFFFSSSDPTRDDTVHFVPTIAYQLAGIDPGIKSTIIQCIDTDPLVFKKSLRSQMEAMVISPLRQAHLKARLSGTDTIPLPTVVIVDGLDECKGESMQTELLKALEHLVRSLATVGLHLRIIITSRPEWTTSIWSAVEKSSLVRHVKLADEYDATEDIRGYVERQLGEIASMSRDPRVRAKGGWPAEEDVEALVQNASGQFIYVVVALCYIAERHSSPVDRLQSVLAWSPPDSAAKHQAHPLSPLDALYAGILRNAQKAYEAFENATGVDDIVMLIRLHQLNKEARFASLLDEDRVSLDLAGFEAFLGMQDGETYGLISDMRSLLTIREAGVTLPMLESTQESAQGAPEDYERIHFYHISLLDFLDDPTRAGEMYVSNADVAAHFVVCALQQITAAFQSDIDALLKDRLDPESPIDHSSRLRVLEFSLHVLASALPELTQLTQTFIDTLYRFTESGGWEKLDKYIGAMGVGDKFSAAFSNVLELYAAGRAEGELSGGVLCISLSLWPS
ncbi:hypothetical protein NMY22_g19519 [Coprinellus aureogranulatus]|nr:hypothetical protein NMY22_g19519 [Coprinellus aureogranulatus]